MDSSPIISGKDRTSQSDKNTNSYKTGSALDFAAKKLHRGPARQDSPRAAAASSNELQNLPHPEHHQTQPAEIQEPDRIQQKDILLKKLYTDAYKLAHYISNIRTFCITFHSYQIPEDYNPYYSMNNVKDKGRINIDLTLPNSSGILAIRRILSLLGTDIYSDATEQKIAELAGHSPEKGTFKMQNALQAFDLDYSSIRRMLSMDDLEKVTTSGYPILTRLYKEGIGGHIVVIEQVSRNENGNHICTIYDPYDRKNQKIRKIPYSDLQLALNDYHLLPTHWRQLTNTSPETAIIQQQNERSGISEPSESVIPPQDTKKVTIEHQALIATSKRLLTEHQTILQESKQALADYQQLQSDSQRYEQKQQEIKAQRSHLLAKLHQAQSETTHLDKLEAQTPSLTALQKLEAEVAQYENRYQSIIQESKELLSQYQQLQSDPQQYRQEQETIKTAGDHLLKQLDLIKKRLDTLPEDEQDIIINEEAWNEYISKYKGKNYKQQECIQLFYQHIKNQLYNLHTLEDKLHIQQAKMEQLADDSEKLHKTATDVLNMDNPCSIKTQLQQILTPEDEICIHSDRIKDSCIKLKEIYQEMTAGSQTTHEGQESSNISTATPDELPENAYAIKIELEHLCTEIQQHIEDAEEHITTLDDLSIALNYNPYYSMDGVKYVETTNISSTLPDPCVILAIRRALFLQGIDIDEDATEQEVAKLAGHSPKGGTPIWGGKNALDHFDINVSCIHEALTINDIECITGCGYSIVMAVMKERLAKNHALLIEKVSRTEKGDPVCTVFDPFDQNLREIPYGTLEAVSTYDYIVPMNYQELTKCLPGSDEMTLRSKQMSWTRSLNRMRQLEKKLAQCQEQEPDILEQSQQALSEYQQLKNDPARYRQEVVKAESAGLLRELDDIKQRIDALPEEEQKIIINDQLWEDYAYLQIDQDYTEQENIRSSYEHIRKQLYNLHTPEYKLYLQSIKLSSLDKSIQDIDQESNFIHQNIVINEQENDNISTTTHPELIKSLDTIKTNIDQLYQGIQEKINQPILQNLLEVFNNQLPENYNPYYSMNAVKDKEHINIDLTLPKSAGIRAIRHTLSLLGTDIDNDATEQKIAELADHSPEEGILMKEMHNTLQSFNTDYSFIRQVLSINDIEKVTTSGYPILAHIFKAGIGGGYVVIEQVSRNENGDHICTTYDPRDPKNQKILEIPYRELQPVLSDYYILSKDQQEIAD